MKKIFAFVESDSDIRIIHNRYNVSKIEWIAVSPFCIPKLQEKGILFHSIYEFLPPSNLFEKINPKSENIRQDIIRITDDWARAQFPFFKENNFFLLKYFQRTLTQLFDNICLKLYCLDRFFSETNPEKIIIRKVKLDWESNPHYLEPWQFNEPVWSLCIEFLIHNKYSNIRIVKFTDMIGTKPRKKDSFIKIINSMFPHFYSFVRTVKRKGLREGYLFYRNKPILVLDQNPWRFTKTLFAQKGYKFVNYIFRNQFRLGEIRTNYFEKIGLRPICNIMGINFAELVENHINQYIQYGLDSFPKIYRKTNKLLSVLKPKAVLFSFSQIPEKWLFLHVARQLDIPVFGWSHGASGQLFYSKQYRDELLVCDYYFTQGQGSNKTYSQYKEFKFSPIPIGMPQLDEFKNKLLLSHNSEETCDFIFAPTIFYKNNFYFSFYPGLIDYEVYSAQCQIVEFLTTFGGSSVMKISLGNAFKGLFYASFGKKINIIDDIELTEIIPKGRAFIIDAPSTTILEVLCTKKPVFVLTQFLKLCNNAETLLKKRAICCPNVELLIKELTAYTETGLFKADVTNQEYLSSYGTFLNNGKSAQRGVETVIEIITGKTPATKLNINKSV